MLGPGISTVYVDGIAHGLEGVKGDADGQTDVQYRQEAQPHCGEGAGDKIPVFEEEQQRQVEHHRRGHRQPGAFVVASLLAPGDQHAVGVVDGDGGEHDEDVLGLAPPVEDQVKDQQHRIAQAQGSDIVDQQYDGQIEKQKIKAGKDQGAYPPVVRNESARRVYRALSSKV